MSTPTPATGPSFGRSAVTAMLIGIATSLAGFLALAIAIWVGVDGAKTTPGTPLTATLRTLFSLAVVVVGVTIALRRVADATPRWGVIIALGGYLLDSWAWGGNALFVAAAIEPGMVQSSPVRTVGFIGDAVVWGLVAHLIARRQERR